MKVNRLNVNFLNLMRQMKSNLRVNDTQTLVNIINIEIFDYDDLDWNLTFVGSNDLNRGRLPWSPGVSGDQDDQDIHDENQR